MRFMTTSERLAKEEGVQGGIEEGRDIKFGAPGLQLMPEVRQIQDLEMLRAVLRAIWTATTLDELRRVWAPSLEGPGRVGCKDEGKRRRFITTPERIGME